ncbi:hypothetical protein [Patulibacter sp.]|uniref:hypothetical protein n=1 Tax=Patulibacter sp. TaxID=1912859 RepID=UPI002719C35F|nr:hypothetical protein [Patulibacter sp.]MDO9408249.1 hypothetical protein [Patulibacter sp.]
MSGLPRFSPIVAAIALAATTLVAAFGLQEFAFSDYEAEVLPAAQALGDGDVTLFLSRLPGYAGAVEMQAPFGLLGGLVGGDTDLWTWRFQALPGLLLLLCLGAVLGSFVAEQVGGVRGTLYGGLSALMVAGSPFAMRAEVMGHPEELLISGLAISAVLAAIRGRMIPAGILIGVAAAAKPWAVVAVPVVMLAAQDRRALAVSISSMVLAGVALTSPALLVHGVGGTAGLVPTAGGDIFKPSQAFWFFGSENPVGHAARSAAGTLNSTAGAPYADRLAVGWASRISHPLIVLVAGALALLYARRPLNTRRGPDLLLLLAAALWWRCVLDTWNADYYALGALLTLAVWSAIRARAPWLAIAVTVAAWITFRGPAAWWNVTPDAHTAIYLAWAVPLGVALSLRAVAPERWRRLVASIKPSRRSIRGRSEDRTDAPIVAA